MMPLARKLVLTASFLSLTGCKLAVIATSGGDVQSSSGVRDCAGGNICEFNITSDDFNDTFTAIPREGYVFNKWGAGAGFRCGDSKNPTCNVSNLGLGVFDGVMELIAGDQIDYAMPLFDFVGIDTDGDGVRDHLDDDDDNDGIFDIDDPCPLEPNPDCGVNELSGTFWEDLYLRKEDGPYILVGDVYIPEFFNLNIGAGADVSSESGSFQIRGNVNIAGTASEPAKLNNTLLNFVGNETSEIFVSYAEFDHSDFSPSFGQCIEQNPTVAHLTIVHTKFSSCGLNLHSPITDGSPLGIVEKNIFDRAYLSLTGSLNVQKNLFLRVKEDSGLTVLLNNYWVDYPSFNYNTILFHPSIGGERSVGIGRSGNVSIDATSNYWGTTDSRIIDLIIFDVNDADPFIYGARLAYTPFLNAPHPDAPVAP